MPRFSLRNALFVVVVVAAAAVATAVFWNPLDSPTDYLLSAILEDDTVWADGYSAAAFKQVQLGMTRAQVHKFLGEPLYWATSSSLPNEAVEWWTHSPADTNYWQRAIVFSGPLDNRKVTKKISGFWVD